LAEQAFLWSFFVFVLFIVNGGGGMREGNEGVEKEREREEGVKRRE
jgi:hypothetical protein